MDNLINLKFYENSENFPAHKSLISLGYFYDENGILRTNFLPYEKYSLNDEKEYRKIADLMIELTQQIILQKYNFRIIPLPFDLHLEKSEYQNYKTKIFVSCIVFMLPIQKADFETNLEKCLVLIQGSPPAKLGIWAENSSILNSLNIGSMVPYIRRAKENNFSVIIFNPNENENPETGVFYNDLKWK